MESKVLVIIMGLIIKVAFQGQDFRILISQNVPYCAADSPGSLQSRP